MLSKGDLNQHSKKCLRNKAKLGLSGSKMSKCKIKEREEKKKGKREENSKRKNNKTKGGGGRFRTYEKNTILVKKLNPSRYE